MFNGVQQIKLGRPPEPADIFPSAGRYREVHLRPHFSLCSFKRSLRGQEVHANP
jgi:hypothetical protein